MKYILSLWTKPLLESKHFKENLKFQLNFCEKNYKFIKENVSDNIEIVTDNYGYEQLKHLTNKIRIDLNNLNHFHNDLWAVGKIYALGLYSEPVCLIDNDFFIKDYNKYKKIINSSWDILVQSKEISPNFLFIYKKFIQIFMTLFNKELLENNIYEIYYYDVCNFSYNCGHLAFQDFRIKNQFVEKAMKIFNIINNNEKIKNFYDASIFFSNRHERISILNINCIIEQVFFTIWATYNNFYVKELCPMREWEMFNGNNNKLNNCQNTSDLYIHYIGRENKEKFKEETFRNLKI